MHGRHLEIWFTVVRGTAKAQITEVFLENLLKLQSSIAHVDHFPKKLGAVNDEQGQRFHKDIKEMEEWYLGTWGQVIVADYCWSLKRDQRHRTAKTHKFLPWARDHIVLFSLV